MNPKELRKKHPDLFRLWVANKFSFGNDPTPQKDKNYIISIVNDSRRCFVVLEYNDGWYAEEGENINIPSKEIISYSGIKKDEKGNEIYIPENSFISLLIEIIKVYSSDELNNNLIACFRTNGAGRVAFDAVKKEVVNMLEMENVQFFPTTRRSKYGKDVFKAKVKKLSQGWEMSVLDEKNCFNAMRTAEEQGYFTLVANKSKQAFGITSNEEQLEFESFTYCWLMLSFIRLSTMQLFN